VLIVFCNARVLIFCFLLVCLQAANAQGLARKQYEIRVDKLGTRLGHAALRSHLPMNRSYAELDEAEKAIVRADYDGMPPDDEPPYPAQGWLPVFSAVQVAMEKLGTQGRLTLVADVDPQGKVQHVDTFGSVDPDFARFLSKVIVATPFKPGICAGQPCAMQSVLRLTFSALPQ
jgi:hypothetical protein